MKPYYAICCSYLLIVSADVADDWSQHPHKEGYGEKWMYMPDGNGVPNVIILKGRPPKSESRLNPHNDVEFRLFTRYNNSTGGQPIRMNDTSSLQSAGYDPSKDVKLVIHGWKSSYDSETVQGVKNAYLEADDVNVVTVDWSALSSSNFYLSPVSQTKPVGSHVGRMVEFLETEGGSDRKSMHVIGHSLGAHVAGYVGESLKPRTLGRITGLDPALPGFQYWAGPSGRLDDTDADFVEVIHTCSGVLGYGTPIGHADFYPNGGSPFQPGCCCLPEFVQACSHGRSHQYFAESISSRVGFKALPCASWDEFKHGKCNDGSTVEMGEHTPTEARGTYFLATNSSSPFALG